MKLLFFVGLAVFLAGCESMGRITDAGAEANDEAIHAAETVICRAASVGSVRRAYGDRPEAWRQLCEPGADFSPVGDE